MTIALNLFKQQQQIANQRFHRSLFALQGSCDWCVEQAQTICNSLTNYTWCGKAPAAIKTTLYRSLLGQDIKVLILNMIDKFDANMFAAAEGAVTGGGVIVLLLPEHIQEQDFFTNYFISQLLLHKLPILKQHQATKHIEHNSTLSACHQLRLSEQQQAIKQIIKTVTGHRKRPLVLTANRGRGKSAALGIAAAQLINQGIDKVIVCAPSQVAAHTLYKHVQLTLNNKQQIDNIPFYAPDLLAQSNPSCNLLIIDEAAAIPLKLLILFTQRYSRIVFASTQFGYEGSGRGFALRFQKQLQQLAPNWRSLQLQQPIRWAKDDPVETFTLSTLCLKEQIPPLSFETNTWQIALTNPKQLIEDPRLLNQVFSLLVNAHYQTKPSDLVALLNDQNLSIVLMTQQEQLLAVALINHEGGFDQQTSELIYQGKRRPTGHLMAQSLTFHSGFIKAACQQFARIQRIAVQPELQKQGLGNALINWLKDWAKQQGFDHLSASFAASPELVRFWLQQGFQVLRIGLQKDKSSGEHSFMVNLALSEQGISLHQQIQDNFKEQSQLLFSRQLQDLDSQLITQLWQSLISKKDNKQLKTALSAYTEANRSYESVEFLLIQLLFNSEIDKLEQKQQRAIINKVIQNHSWQTVVTNHQFTGKKQAQAYIKQAIRDLINLETI